MKILSFALIFLGFIIMVIPISQKMYTSYWQSRLLREWEDKLAQENAVNSQVSSSLQNSYNSLSSVFDNLIALDDNNEIATITPEDIEYNNLKYDPTNTSNQDVLGVLYIDVINLKLPIMRGTTERVLQVGVGKLEGTTPIGEIGNTALSAHRGHSYGRLFNRLDEVSVGDIVKIQTKNNKLNYEVYEVKIVEPNNLSVLNSNTNDKILTLITCHPLYTSTHRLIVHARLA